MEPRQIVSEVPFVILKPSLGALQVPLIAFLNLSAIGSPTIRIITYAGYKGTHEDPIQSAVWCMYVDFDDLRTVKIWTVVF